jgi:hypothetical protein
MPHHVAGNGSCPLHLQVREVRLVRREGRSSVCLVLLRFDAQTAADGFFRDFNGRPVGRTAVTHSSAARAWCLLGLQRAGSCLHRGPATVLCLAPCNCLSRLVLPAGAGAAVSPGVREGGAVPAIGRGGGCWWGRARPARHHRAAHLPSVLGAAGRAHQRHCDHGGSLKGSDMGGGVRCVRPPAHAPVPKPCGRFGGLARGVGGCGGVCLCLRSGSSVVGMHSCPVRMGDSAQLTLCCVARRRCATTASTTNACGAGATPAAPSAATASTLAPPPRTALCAAPLQTCGSASSAGMWVAGGTAAPTPLSTGRPAGTATRWSWRRRWPLNSATKAGASRAHGLTQRLAAQCLHAPLVFTPMVKAPVCLLHAAW